MEIRHGSSIVQRLKRSRLLSSIVIGGIFLAVGGTIGSADSSVVYSGCENVATGVIRLLNNTNLVAPYNACLTADVITARHLASALTEVPISWNQVGPQGLQGQPGQNGAPGQPGESVSATALATGDANCPNGGSKFGVGGVMTFACNGARGANGKDGVNGTNGTDGKDGTSVTSAVLPVGDPHCANGGSSFTSASGTTYACTGGLDTGIIYLVSPYEVLGGGDVPAFGSLDTTVNCHPGDSAWGYSLNHYSGDISDVTANP